MKTKNRAGFEEIPHTADWAIRVWAPDLAELFVQAAGGMETLMGVNFAGMVREKRDIDIRADDAEGLLVAFLSEILFVIETENSACGEFSLSIDGNHLTGSADCGKIRSIGKEIKAVTYHRLKIETGENYVQTTIVFDV